MIINPNFMISVKIRNSLYQALNLYTELGKIMSSRQYGIDYKKIIEKLIIELPEDFERRKYHIDHIKPLCSFYFINKDGSTNLEEVKKAFAPENLRWLLAEDNLKKIAQDLQMSIRRKNVE